MSFPGTIFGDYGDEKQTSTAKKHPLGTRIVLPDGRVFRYASAGEALGAGKLCMQAIGVANHDMDLAVQAAAAIGASSIAVTLGATAAAVNLYADGYIYINDGPGEGHIYRIKSHAAVASGATLTAVLADGETVREALTTAESLAGLMVNPYTSVELYDADDVDGPPVGVAATEIASASYGWLQTWGYAAVLSGAGVVTLGKTAVPNLAADGGVKLMALTEAAPPTGADQPHIGIGTLIACVDTDYGVFFLTIAA